MEQLSPMERLTAFISSRRTSKTPKERALERGSHVLPWVGDPFTQYDDYLDQDENKPRRFRKNNGGSGSDGGDEDGYIKTAPIRAVTIQQHEREVALEIKIQDLEKQRAVLPIQLLYDLFFVANLSAITSDKQFYNPETLTTYVLFFAVLWFTWLQTTFHDLRFSVDSLYERICKTLQFSLMVVFAARSREWDPFRLGEDDSIDAIRYCTMALMATRLLLAFQYGVVSYFAWRSNKPDLKLIIAHSIIMLSTTFIYLIVCSLPSPAALLANRDKLYFVFRENAAWVRYWFIWYILLPLEAVAIIASSFKGKSLAFRDAHLIDRMGSLTLIVLGEGIIVLIRSVETITNSELGWQPQLAMTVLSAMYLCWMFYFDYIPSPRLEHESVRQHIWAVLHFPLHVALVVYAEGTRQFVTLWSYMDHFAQLRMAVPILPDDDPVHHEPTVFREMKQESIDTLRRWFVMLNSTNRASTVELFHDEDLARLDSWSVTNGTNLTAAEENLQHRKNIGPVFWDVLEGLLELFDLRHPDKEVYRRPTAEQVVAAPVSRHGFGVWVPPIMEEAMVIIFFIFRALVISIGVIFLLYAVLAVFVRGRNDIYDGSAIALRLALAVIFLSFMGITGTFSTPNEATLGKLQSGAGKILDSEWLGIVILTIMFSALLLGKGIDYVAYKRAKERYHQWKHSNASPEHAE